MKDHFEQGSLREKLLPGQLSAEGFLGDDRREPQEIIRDDDAAIACLGTTHTAIASRMRLFTAAGESGLGRPVLFEDRYEVTVTDARGAILCPFCDSFQAGKQQTNVLDLETGRVVFWTDLNIHMIDQHGFFEGRGAYFRVDPTALWTLVAP